MKMTLTSCGDTKYDLGLRVRVCASGMWEWVRRVKGAEGLDARLRAGLLKLAKGGGKDAMGRLRLTQGMVVGLRDGSAGEGVFRAMTRLVKRHREGGERVTAGDWLWWRVAELQKAGLVSPGAQRRRPSRWKGGGKWDRWKERLESGSGGQGWRDWVTRVEDAMEKLRGGGRGLRVLRRENWRRLQQNIKGVRAGTTADMLRVACWELSAERGWLIEGQDSDVVIGGGWREKGWWEKVGATMEKLGWWDDRVRGLMCRVLGWAKVEGLRGEQRYLVHWCAGWAEGFRKVVKEAGLGLIAVDLEATRMGKHKLNVVMDLLLLSPMFWRREVAARVGVGLGQLYWDWAGVPCTTYSRADASNRRQVGGRQVFNNYRKPGGGRQPQHAEGTEKGDLARGHDRLVEGMVWMLKGRRVGAWALENPVGALQQQGFMQQVKDRLCRVDYCRYWSKEERRKGFLWQKKTVVWAWREKDAGGGKWVGEGEDTLCRGSCLCGYRKGGSWYHRGGVERVGGMVKELGLSREAIKCRYPKELLRSWVRWAQGNLVE
jgi:hypothetical protein